MAGSGKNIFRMVGNVTLSGMCDPVAGGKKEQKLLQMCQSKRSQNGMENQRGTLMGKRISLICRIREFMQ